MRKSTAKEKEQKLTKITKNRNSPNEQGTETHQKSKEQRLTKRRIRAQKHSTFQHKMSSLERVVGWCKSTDDYNHFYIALLFPLEQTRCTQFVWWVTVAFYNAFWISYSAVCLIHGWCHVRLLPSRRVLYTPYNHAPCHITSCKAIIIRLEHACLTATCYLHFWQNDRDYFACHWGNTRESHM